MTIEKELMDKLSVILDQYDENIYINALCSLLLHGVVQSDWNKENFISAIGNMWDICELNGKK